MEIMRERLIGLGLLVGGLVLSYLCVYEPLQAAARNDPKVSLSLKGALLCPGLVLYGLAMFLFGNSITAFLGTREKPTLATWVCAFAVLALGFILYQWLKSTLESSGYAFK
jgi:hypothetical protein